MKATTFLNQQTEAVRSTIQQVKPLRNRSENWLRQRPQPAAWNTLECLEHLNQYGDFYLPAVEQAMAGQAGHPVEYYQSGWLGGYFAKQMLPREKLNAMSSPKDYNPFDTNVSVAAVDRFLDQQNRLLTLLQRAAEVDINRIKVPISLTRWIRLRLGDTFHFYINHQRRHMAQLRRIERAIGL